MNAFRCIYTKPQYTTLPKNGIPKEEVLRMMKDMKQKEDPHWKSGKISGIKSFDNKFSYIVKGGVYIAEDEHIEMMNQAYAMYSMSNPLHPDIWPSVRKYEIEV